MQSEFYKKILNSVHDHIVVVSKDYRVIYYNQSFETLLLLLGKDLSDFSGRDLTNLLPESLKEIIPSMEDCFRKGEIIRQIFSLSILNTPSYIDLVVIPDYSGNTVQSIQIILRDATDVELQRQELNQKVQFFSQLVRYAPLGVFLIDLDNTSMTISHWNPAMTDNFILSESEALGRDLKEIYPFSVLYKEISAAVDAIIQTRLFYKIPELAIPPHKQDSGSIRYFNLNLVPIKQDSGPIFNILGIMDDITEQTLKDRKLQKYKSKLESNLEKTSNQLDETTAEISSILNNSSGVCIFSLDSYLNYRVFNTYHKLIMSRMFKKEIREGDSYLELIRSNPEFHDLMEKYLSNALYGVIVKTEIELKIDIMGPQFYDTLISPLYSEQLEIMGVTVILIDTTDLRQSEKEAFIFKTVADNANYGVMITDQLFQIHYCNRYWETLFGYAEYSLTGKKADIIFHEDNLSRIRQSIRKFSDGGGAMSQLELDLQTVNNEYMTVLLNIVVYGTDKSNPEGIAFTCMDITPMKDAREAIILARDNAEKASVLKSSFVSNMSHEIRTPLNSIIGFSRLLETELTSEKQKGLLNSLVSSSRILKGLISDILDFSKIEAGKMTLDSDIIESREFFLQLFQMFSIQAGNKNLTFSVVSTGKIPERFVSDSIRIRQILMNLLGNAIKFTDSGIVTLFIEYTAEERQFIISVSDSGMGIPTADINLIFNPFEQKEKEDKRRFEGTGLGLSISKQLIELMNGTIRVSSEEYKGSRFRITIPVETYGNDLIELPAWSSTPEIEIENPVCFSTVFFPEYAGFQKKWGYSLVNVETPEGLPAEALADGSSIFIHKYSEPVPVYNSMTRICICSPKEMINREDSPAVKYIIDGLPDDTVFAKVRSYLAVLKIDRIEKEPDFSQLSDGEIEELLHAVETKDSTEIHRMTAILQTCGAYGPVLSDEIMAALENFEIPLLNVKLEEVANSLKKYKGDSHE